MMSKLCLIVPIFVLAICSMLTAQDNLKAFPDADAGMERFVLQLPEKEDESLFRVELLVGKKTKVDEQNRYFFAGEIETRNIEGWGFERYVVSKIGPLAGTRMAVDPSKPLVEKFVKLGGEPFLLRYNSRLPVVVYVPKGAEVRCRIWVAQEELQEIPRG